MTLLLRSFVFALLVLMFNAAPADAASSKTKKAATKRTSFEAFVVQLWPAASARGVSRTTFDLAFKGVTPDPSIVELTRKQSEFVKPVWDYLSSATAPVRVQRGITAHDAWGDTLSVIEQRYGVDRSVLLGVWGMETSFGGFTGGKDVIRSLATLAAIKYRGTYFRTELLTALEILQQGHVERSAMRGSWAGAMGQTQFMPTSFRTFAVDFDGDGHKNIWTSVPDALASSAEFLRQKGWQQGLPWGFEVILPSQFDFRTGAHPFSDWRASGIARADGRAMPDQGEARLFLPAGAAGPAFLVTANFDVIKRYNASDAYALGVAHLGDLLMGGEAFRAAWPEHEKPLTQAQRIEIQKTLTRLGYAVGKPDGRMGSRTREAIRDFQRRRGIIPDGYPNERMLEALRNSASL